MSLFDTILSLAESPAGSAILGQLAQHLPDVLAQHGINGAGDLVQKLQQAGLGQQVASWLGSGQNQPVSAQQIEQALGSPVVTALAQRFGIDPAQASQFLAEHLPQIIAALGGGQQA